MHLKGDEKPGMRFKMNLLCALCSSFGTTSDETAKNSKFVLYTVQPRVLIYIWNFLADKYSNNQKWCPTLESWHIYSLFTYFIKDVLKMFVRVVYCDWRVNWSLALGRIYGGLAKITQTTCAYWIESQENSVVKNKIWRTD